MPAGNYGGGPFSGYDLPAFRVKFPEFVDVPDAQVGGWLDEAMIWLDKSVWSEKDYPLAVLYWTAHNLQITQRQVGSATGGSGSKFTGSLDLYVKSASFGERRFTFAQRTSSEGGASGSTGPGESLLETTQYGSLFLLLRNRNIFPVLIV